LHDSIVIAEYVHKLLESIM